MSHLDRRRFLIASGLAAASPALVRPARAGASVAGARSRRQPGHAGDEHRGPCVIASGNGLAAVEKAMADMKAGADPVDAIVAGVGIVEADPNDMSVGYGGLPNEEGVVQLDSSVMHGPTHKAGAVAAIENIMHPAQVALLVLKHTDHVMIVGEGAKRFALAHGFKEENLLTDRARQAWLRWKRNLSPNDDWLDDDQTVTGGKQQGARADIPFTYGTIHCSAVDARGDLSGCTTTSGLSWKIPGRVGDSPIVGAGMYTDNEFGSAGATGRGEAVIQSCGAYEAVQAMGRGMTPTEACLHVLERIASRTKRKDLLDDRGRPNFGVTMYAVRKDGAYGSAAITRGTFAVHDGNEARVLRSTPLFE